MRDSAIAGTTGECDAHRHQLVMRLLPVPADLAAANTQSPQVRRALLCATVPEIAVGMVI